MWPAIFEGYSILCAVVLCAISVKLMDDFLDYDHDQCTGCYNFVTQLGRGTPVYAMLALALAASIHASVSIPLFLASYIVGMFKISEHTFYSHLNGLEESLLIFILGVLLWSWKIMIFSTFFVFAVQLFDDYMDFHTDRFPGYRNLAHRLGKIECLLLSILMFLLSWHIQEHMFLYVLSGTAIFYSTLLYYQRRNSSC